MEHATIVVVTCAQCQKVLQTKYFTVERNENGQESNRMHGNIWESNQVIKL